MESNFAVALNHVLVHEGGYTDHPRDPGGATNKGVIQRVYDAYRRRHGLTPRSVAFIADHEITAIYRTQYWNKIEGDALPKGIDYCVFDAAVNSGPARGARWLQKAINKCAGYKRVKVDQDIGSATLDAADDYPPHDLINAMCDIRVGFLRRLSTFDVFGRGYKLAKRGRAVQLRVVPLSEESCQVALTSDLGNERAGWFWGFGVAVGVPMTWVWLMFIMEGGIIPDPWLLATPAIIAGTVALARLGYRRGVEKMRLTLEGVLDRLEHDEPLEPPRPAWRDLLR